MIKYKNRLLDQIEIYIIPICIILLSFIKFYVANIKRLDVYGVAELSKIFTIIIIVILLLTFIFSKLNKLKFNENLFFLSLCFYSLFFHFDLKNILPLGNNSSEISLLIIVINFFIIWYFLKFKKFKRVISIYFIFLFLLNVSIILKEKVFSYKDINDISSIESKNSYKKLNDNIQENMYLIILDEATSLELFENNYDTKVKNKYLNIVEKKNYTYIKNSFSSYNTTEITFASFFHLDYFVTDKSPKIKDTLNLYPQMLRYNYNYLPLIQILKENNYNFYLIGNTRNSCTIKKETCLNEKQLKQNFINYEIVEIFLMKSPLVAIYNKVSERFRRILKIKSFNENYKNNDAISKFISFTNGSIPEKSFFLIHNFYPHAPYIYDQNCNEKKAGQVITSKNTNQAEKSYGYYENYLCALKKTLEIINYIDKHDPDAVVIIQADHGHYFNNNKNIREKMEIFNLVKEPNQCKTLLNEEIDNVNAARLLLRCGLNIDIKILNKESYWTPYSTRDKNWGRINRL